jgi:hypothetical protein
VIAIRNTTTVPTHRRRDIDIVLNLKPPRVLPRLQTRPSGRDAGTAV